MKDGSFKGSRVTYKLNEPWQGFIDSDDSVSGAHLQNLLKLFDAIVGGGLSHTSALPSRAKQTEKIIY